MLNGITNNRGELSNVEWVLWEWIQSDWIEGPIFEKIVSQDVIPKLSAPLKTMSSSILEDAKQFLPTYESIDSYLSYLQNELIPLIKLPHTTLGFDPDQSMSNIREMIHKSGYGKESAGEFYLIHQDRHEGNVLCRKIKQTRARSYWDLAAVIDWEFAALAPIDFLLEDEERPDEFHYLVIFGQLLKHAWLASGYTTDPSQIPSCDFEELMSYTNGWLEELKEAGLLSADPSSPSESFESFESFEQRDIINELNLEPINLSKRRKCG